jgi:hypothetical protein
VAVGIRHERQLAVVYRHLGAVQDGDTVIGFLAGDGRFIAEFGESHRRELVFLAFDFLQQQQIGLLAG